MGLEEMAAGRLQPDTAPDPGPRIDWEAFYGSYRKPGYVPGFEIINKLGGGMFGLVFKARKESIGKDYAIKFLKVDDESIRDAVTRELDSVKHFAQIDHPNLVSIEDMGDVDGIPYLVMSYAGQETLRKRINKGDMQREDALRIFAQAARGVQALHDHSLVHFDLKPANIFLKGDVARVGDFGLSKLVTESRNSLSFGRGTPYYMAPEMLQRRGDTRSDIYSLGVILFECLCGEVPFRGDSEWEVLRKHESAEVPFPEYLADQDRQIIARCLAKDPDDRYDSVAALLRDLQAPVALGESLLIRSAPGAIDATPEPAAPASPASPAPNQRPPVLGDAQAAMLRDPADSPYQMPWRDSPASSNRLLAFLVRQVFRVFELVIFVVMLPVRLLSGASGSGLSWLFELPVQLVQFAVRVLGLTLAIALIALIVVAVVLFAGAL